MLTFSIAALHIYYRGEVNVTKSFVVYKLFTVVMTQSRVKRCVFFCNYFEDELNIHLMIIFSRRIHLNSHMIA